MQFLELSTLTEQLVLNAGIIGLSCLAIGVWLYLNRLLSRLAAKTDTKLDDILVHTLSLPILLFIIFVSAYSLIYNIAPEIIGLNLISTDQVITYTLLVFMFWIFWRFINELEHLAVNQQENVLPGKLQDKVKVSRHGMRIVTFSLRIIVVIIALLTIINMAGVSLTGLLAFGGLGGIILGFALKDPLSNFVAGALIFWEKPFAVGDWVRCPAENIEGVVENITWRTTLLKTFERRPIYVPNAVFMNNVVENAQRMTNRRIYETISVRYDDLDKLNALLQEIRQVMKEHDGIDDEQSLIVSFTRYGDSALEFLVYAITFTTTLEGFQEVKQDILFIIGDLVKKHKMEFAYPTTRVMLEKTPDAELADKR